MTIIIAAVLTNLIICYFLSRYYEQWLDQYREAWLKQRQTIYFQFQRIEELETERERLHEVAVKALPELPRIEEYHEVGGIWIVVRRN